MLGCDIVKKLIQEAGQEDECWAVDDLHTNSYKVVWSENPPASS